MSLINRDFAVGGATDGDVGIGLQGCSSWIVGNDTMRGRGMGSKGNETEGRIGMGLPQSLDEDKAHN